MPVPNEVVFANDRNQIITYGQVRQFDEARRLHALRKRLDYWLLDQIDPLCRRSETGDLIIYSPFPLAILSCITIETLGNVFFGVPKGTEKQVFERAAIYLDQKLKSPMKKGFLEKLKNLWPGSGLKETRSASDVLYKFFRNTMAHGYYAKSVFLTADIDPDPWRYDEGFLQLHPWNFWKLVRERGYERMFSEILDDKNESMRHCALVYIDVLMA